MNDTFPYTPLGLNVQREIAATWSWPLGDGEWDTHAYRFTLSTSQPPQAILSDQIFSFTTDDGGGYPEYERERVSGINAAGQIVGSAGIGNSHWAAFRWQAGTKKLIHAPHWFYSYGSAISHLGHIAGSFQSAAHQWRVLPFLWEEDGTPSGEFHEIGLQNFNVGFSYGFTATGRLFGSYQDRVLWRYRGFIWDQGQISYPSVIGMADLDLIALNDRGDLLARTWSPSYYAFSDYPFLLRAGSTTPLRLGTLGGAHAVARAMNESGQIIGKSLTRSGLYHAFVWAEGRMLDLNSLTNLNVSGSSATWEITDALSLNTKGDIGGVATRWNAPPTGPEERGVILLATVRDTDGDGMSDDWETYHGLDPSLATDAAADPDGDGLTNLQEFTYHSDPLDFDNLAEHPLKDSDQNGLADWWEILHFGSLGQNPDTVVSVKGLTLRQIFLHNLDLSSDSTVQDEIPDSWKLAHGLSTSGTEVSNEDADDDGLSNNDEYASGTNPQIADTDGDGIKDGFDTNPKTTNPSAPSNLQVTVPSWKEQSEAPNPNWSLVNWTKVELQWEAASFDPSGYRIERRHDSDTWNQVATVGAGTTTQKDEGLIANRHYQYRVIAFKNAGGPEINSVAAQAEYEVPLNLKMSVKLSSLRRWKIGFPEFTNPSTPAKYFLNKTNSLTSSDSQISANSTWNYNEQFSYTETIAPGTHSKTYDGVYEKSSVATNYGVSSSESQSSTFHWLEQARTKQNPVSETQGSLTADQSSSAPGGSSSSNYSWSRSADYLKQGAYQAQNGSPKWMGDDFDLLKGTVIWSGQASDTKATTWTSGGTSSEVQNASIAPNGDWSGTSVRSSSGGTPSTTNLYGPPWAGTWEDRTRSSWVGIQSETNTTRVYRNMRTPTNRLPNTSGSIELSQEYTTTAFVSDAINDLPDYPEDWDDDWYGWGYYSWGYWGFDHWSQWGTPYPMASPFYGWWIAERKLYPSEDQVFISKAKYKFEAEPSAPRTIRWYEVFIPTDDPATPMVNESTQIQILRERSWHLGENNNESEEFEIDPSSDPRDGHYTILIEPVHIRVAGIGDGGKNTAGQENTPGKVVLINSSDPDNDGIPGYADGFNLKPHDSDDDLSQGTYFSPITVGFHACDPQRAKIKFTYDASDPAQLTASPTEPFLLPGAGKIRLWLVDGPGRWVSETASYTPRNSAPVKLGGDFIEPNVEYTFAELGITSPDQLTVYVEAVKVSRTVADIPIKVEVNPTGLLNPPWSDQLRFTATSMTLLGRSYGTLDFLEGPAMSPSNLLKFDEKMAAYNSTPGGFLTYKIKIEDPRQALSKVNLNGQGVPLHRDQGRWLSDDFICVVPGLPVDYAQAPALRLLLTLDESFLEYNPWEMYRYWRNGNVPPIVQYVTAVVEGRQQAMEAAGWRPPLGNTDAGIFGKELEKWTANYFRNPNGTAKTGWAIDVIVNNATNKVVSINGFPKVGTEGTTQIDLLAVRNGYQPKVGRPLASSRILYVFDIKSSHRLYRDDEIADYCTRVKQATGKDKVYLTQTKRNWHFGSARWHNSQLVAQKSKLMRFIAAFGIVSVIGGASDADAAADECIKTAVEYKQALENGESNENVFAAKVFFFEAIRSYMNMFSVGGAADLPNILAIQKWLLQDNEDSAIFKTHAENEFLP